MPKSERINGNGYKRVTIAEKNNRIEISATWLLENPDATWKNFIDWCVAKWNYKQNQANIYWKDARTYLNETISEDAESARKIAEASLKKMLRKAIAEDDNKLALEIRKEINKISGVYTQKIEISDNREKPIFNITPINTDGLD